jgi:hypothetical protein
VTGLQVTRAGTGTLAAGLTDQLTATATLSNATTADVTSSATWQSSDTAVATVSVGGVVTAVAAGAVTFTASYQGKSAIHALTVTADVLNSITVTPSANTVANGLTVTLTATGNYTTGTRDITSMVTFGGAAFTFAGNVATAASAGPYPVSASITASLSGVTSAPVAVSITAPVLQSIAITPGSPRVAVGDTTALTATGTYSSGAPADITQMVTWNSGDTAKATISNSGTRGVATGVAVGTSMVTASLGGVTSPALTLTVDSLVSIAVTPASPWLLVGQTAAVTVTGTYSSGATADVTSQATLSTSVAGVASLGGSGASRTLTGVALGSSNIGATLGALTAPVYVMDVTPEAIVSIAITPSTSQTTTVFGYIGFQAIVTYQSGTMATLSSTVHWLSSAPSVLPIMSYGGSIAASTGTTQVRASFAGVTSAATMVTVN